VHNPAMKAIADGVQGTGFDIIGLTSPCTMFAWHFWWLLHVLSFFSCTVLRRSEMVWQTLKSHREVMGCGGMWRQVTLSLLLREEKLFSRCICIVC